MRTLGFFMTKLEWSAKTAKKCYPYRENLRCHACDWHTHRNVVQYIVWAESAKGKIKKITYCILYTELPAVLGSPTVSKVQYFYHCSKGCAGGEGSNLSSICFLQVLYNSKGLELADLSWNNCFKVIQGPGTFLKGRGELNGCPTWLSSRFHDPEL